MARAIAIGTAIGAAIAACFTAPTRPPGDGLRDDAGNPLIDASSPDDADPDAPFVSPDGPADTCTVESFTGSGSGTCGTSGWATLSAGSGYASLASDQLQLGLFGSASAFVQCASQTNAVQRVTIDVSTIGVTAAGGESVFVGLSTTDRSRRWGVEFSNDATSGTPGYAVICADGVVASPTKWESSQQRFFQIEKYMMDSVRISSSANNISYQQLQVCGAAEVYAGATQVQLRKSKPGTSSGSITSTFEWLEICR